tara:strand:- start:71 stop:1036 length:966 start_codon:yes stop_codon:yes gene_type:complete
MSFNPILVVSGEPNSIFLEIYLKSLKKIRIKNPLILIGSKNLIKLQMNKLGLKKKIKNLDLNNIHLKKLNNQCINLININYITSKPFEKITSKSNDYIAECFKTAFHIINKYKIEKLINGPIKKETFLNKKFLGLTEFISNKFNVKENAMLIYNNKLAVCPVTTHTPLKFVTKAINRTVIINKIKIINNFYKLKLKKNPKIAVLGLNPHCESIDKFNEDEKIVKPAIKYLIKKKMKVSGPFSADTIFLKQNRNKYDVIVGMYHDQVLTPMKTLFEYDAINITLGLPFLRVSPDHGPNEKMMGKNISNPLSLIKAITFLDKY